jgi:hypothetical protein
VKTRQHFIDDYREATEAEAVLWLLVQGNGPGTPGYDPETWRRWIDAVGRTTEASKALREAFPFVPGQ